MHKVDLAVCGVPDIRCGRDLWWVHVQRAEGTGAWVGLRIGGGAHGGKGSER